MKYTIPVVFELSDDARAVLKRIHKDPEDGTPVEVATGDELISQGLADNEITLTPLGQQVAKYVYYNR